MAKTKRNPDKSKPVPLIDSVRAFLEQEPQATPAEIATGLQQQGIDITLKLARAYSYRIRRQKREKKRKPREAAVARVVAEAPSRVEQAVSGSKGSAGLDDLLQAADKLGWQRVKEIVDRIVQAPA